MPRSILITTSIIAVLALRCSAPQPQSEHNAARIPVILDTDANNELDDQHAIAYLVLNPAVFDVKGITVNATRAGGGIDQQYAEAARVMQLCDVTDQYPLLKGANGSFSDIAPTLADSAYDGHEAVDFIIQSARAVPATDTLVVIAVGKLTNPALAIKKDPSIANRIRLVWLGSNYPQPGEYNQDNDTVSMNYLLNSGIRFEMVTVRYGKPSGTDAVRVTKKEVNEKMVGLGPESQVPVAGRHGGLFRHFGDYSISLFEHIEYGDDPPSRALFDMAAVAIVKNPSWARATPIPAPILINNVWVDRPDSPNQMILWENFDRNAIVSDLFSSLGYKVE